MRHRLSCLTLAVLCSLGCTPAARPAILDQTQNTAQSDGAEVVKRLAPQAFARAESLRLEAEEAHSAGHTELASVRAERALVAFDRAAVEARKVQAMERIAQATRQSEAHQTEIAKLTALQAEIAAETKRVERLVDIEVNLLLRPELIPDNAARTAARARAARSITESARLFCAAARLLAPNDASTLEATRKTDELFTKLDTLPAHEALTGAMVQRVSCLGALSRLRRKAARSAADPGDEFLASLSPSFTDLRPHRDDRGVVLTARGAWDGRQLTSAGRSWVERVGKLADARSLPLLVVLHPAEKGGSANPTAATDELSRALPHAAVVTTTTPAPNLYDFPSTTRDGARIEFIFVTP
jgi:hypothetical protein